MSVFPVLMRLHLKGLFGINAAVKTADPDKKRKTVFRIAGMCVLMAMLLSSVFSSYMGAAYIFSSTGGSAEGVLTLGVLAATAFSLLTAVVSGGTALFASKDRDLLLAMPIPARTVMLYREYSLYMYLLLFAAFLFVPAAAAYAVTAAPAWWFYPTALGVLLLLPVPPLVAGCALGVFVAVLLARFRGKNIIKTVLYCTFFVGVMMIYTVDLNDETMERVFSAASSLAGSVYPPAAWTASALSGGSAAGLAAFVPACLLLLWGFTALAERMSNAVNAGLTAAAAGRRYRVGELRVSSPARAVFRKEFRRFLSSPLYMMNTCAGLVLMLILSVAYVIKGGDAVSAMFGGLFSPGPVLPALLSLICVMSSTTASAISLEGRALPLLLSLPVKGRDLVRGKCLVNLVMLVPAVVVSATVLTVFGACTGVTAVMLYVLPLCYAVFISLLGLSLNVAMPKLDWKNEQQVIKQSASVGFTLLAGFGAALPALAAGILSLGEWLYPATAAAVLAASALMYSRLSKRMVGKLTAFEG